MADGDAGNEFLQNVLNFGGEQDNGQAGQSSPAQVGQQAEQMQAQANYMKQAALNGDLRVTDKMGDEMMKVIDNYLDGWDQNKKRFDHLAESPKLGSSPYADQVGRHIQLVAEGDDQSAKTQLDAAERVMHDFRAAIEIAKKKYREIDEGNADDLRNIKPE